MWHSFGKGGNAARSFQDNDWCPVCLRWQKDCSWDTDESSDVLPSVIRCWDRPKPAGPSIMRRMMVFRKTYTILMWLQWHVTFYKAVLSVFNENVQLHSKLRWKWKTAESWKTLLTNQRKREKPDQTAIPADLISFILLTWSGQDEVCFTGIEQWPSGITAFNNVHILFALHHGRRGCLLLFLKIYVLNQAIQMLVKN